MNRGVAFKCPEHWNQITKRVIACAMSVHSELGPGLLERLYEEAFEIELQDSGLEYQRQYPIRVMYKGRPLSLQKIGLVVEDLVVVEIKSIERIPNVHLARLVSYMRSGQLPLGLLINFDVLHLRDGLFRRLNCDCTAVDPYLEPSSNCIATPSPPLSSSV
jgi:GxxExxY protein